MRPARDDQVEQTRQGIEDLIVFYLDLHNVTGVALTKAGSEGSQVKSTRVVPVPIRPEVVDLIGDVALHVDRLESMLRRRMLNLGPAMRHDIRARDVSGFTPDQRVIDALRWLSSTLSGAYDAGHGSDVERTVWLLHAKARRALGMSERAYLLNSVCPYCATYSIVARPDKGIVTCGNPACRDPEGRRWVWRVGDHLPVWDGSQS